MASVGVGSEASNRAGAATSQLDGIAPPLPRPTWRTRVRGSSGVRPPGRAACYVTAMRDVAPDSYCAHARDHATHGPYHDREYGFPVADDRALFERLCLEINQAGLSWLTILKKRDAFRQAYGGFDPATVGAYGPADRARLLADPGIVRNRLKVDAAIHNAARILEIQGIHGSFRAWLDRHLEVSDPSGPRARTLQEWVKLFRRHFRFTGGQITREFLVSTGYLPGAHDPACPVYRRVAALGPPWMRMRIPETAG